MKLRQLLIIPAFALPLQAATQYWKTSSASSLTGSFWGAAPGGPYTSAWVSGSDITFEANGGTLLTITGASTTIGNIVANENTTFTAGGTLATGGTVKSITVANGKTLTLGGQALSTAAGTGFIKEGLGTLSLTGAAFTGGFTLNAGTVLASGQNALGSGALTLAGGTKLSASNATTRNLTITGVTISGDVTLGDTTNTGILTFGTGSTAVGLGAATRTLTVNSAVILPGVVSGSASVGITKEGIGTLTLNNTGNTYSGLTTINNGAVQLAGIGATAANGIKVNSQGAIGGAAYSTLSLWLSSGKLDNTSTGALAITAASSETIDFNAAGYSNLRLGAIGSATYTGTFTPGTAGAYLFGGSGNLSYSTAISSGSVNKTGTGSLTLTTANTFAGGTVVTAGAGNGTFNQTTGALIFANGNSLGSGTIDFSGATAGITGLYATATTAVANDIILPTSAAFGVTHLNGNTTTYSGIISGGAAGNTITFGAGTTSNPTAVTLLTNALNTFKGKIYAGRGVIAITSNGALGDAANTIQLDQGGSNGQFRFDANNIDVTHDINHSTTTSFNVNGNDATLSGAITGNPTVGVIGGALNLGNSSGSLTISGSNTSTATYNVAANTKFIAASVNALGGGTKTVSAGGTVAFKSVGTYTSAGQINLNGSGTQVASVGVGALENIAGDNVFNNVVNLQSNSTIGVTADSLTLGTGITGGAVSLTKIGAGTLTLNGASNTYTGTTTVSAGTLLINGSLDSTATTTVDATATIGGNGTFNGAVAVNGKLSPGNSPGQMDLNGQNLTMGSASTATMELGGTARGTTASNYDSVIDIGTITLDGTWTVSLVNAFTPAVNNMFDLFDATTVVATGFNVASDLVLPTLGGGLSWDKSSFTTNGQITVIPETSTVLLGSLAMLGLLRRRRN